ncbi:hypothetical protein Ciccas_014248 [Cichlidogyrus casuarinus]|uniref:Uncharacterized protein n=1 Tax=Cichlidogyrus casuarinus TaxID=1844966 RepID=A0ABD2PJP6_9PLAT
MVLRKDTQMRFHAISKSTALGVCNPNIDLEISNDFKKLSTPFPLIPCKAIVRSSPPELDCDRPPKVGSTQFPAYSTILDRNSNTEFDKETLYFTDNARMRHMAAERFSDESKEKIDEDYTKTINDFFRMELDKMDQIHPKNRENMKQLFLAYLQNSTGSKKALHECLQKMQDRVVAAAKLKKKQGDKQT